MTEAEVQAMAELYATEARMHLDGVLAGQGLTLADFDPKARARLYAEASRWVVDKRGDPTAAVN